MSARAKMSKAQGSMLRMLARWEGDGGGGYWEYVACRDDCALVVRNADRVIDALRRRGFVTPEGEDVEITAAGKTALALVQP